MDLHTYRPKIPLRSLEIGLSRFVEISMMIRNVIFFLLEVHQTSRIFLNCLLKSLIPYIQPKYFFFIRFILPRIFFIKNHNFFHGMLRPQIKFDFSFYDFQSSSEFDFFSTLQEEEKIRKQRYFFGMINIYKNPVYILLYLVNNLKICFLFMFLKSKASLLVSGWGWFRSVLTIEA